jgi:hypothetical protein
MGYQEQGCIWLFFILAAAAALIIARLSNLSSKWLLSAYDYDQNLII